MRDGDSSDGWVILFDIQLMIGGYSSARFSVVC